MHPLVLTVALPSCASLISLKLGICEFLDLRQLQYFVGAFPQLQHLDIEEVSVASRISSLVTSALPRPELISLRVHCPMKYSADGSDCYGDLLSWLEYTPSIRSLRDVSLVLHSPGELVCSTILLRKLGRNLECLTLRLARQTRFCRSSSAFLTHYHTGDGQFSIEYCTGLRMLCFEEYAESSTSADDAAADLVVLLTQLPVPGRLRELRVLLNPLKVSRWERICAALPRKKFCSLELISVRYWWIKKAASSMQWEREVAEVLSSCCPGVRVRFQGLTWFAS
ncbi:hypothetical protein SCP_0200490 [Sparassis crispa]|uniref:F-box domain-containing protein n=1 Tax=Sparassis crispa TaxID=139825 RepID=A0A401G9K9_9APHY|nr:hypothetical protein SCP_0200490 [Sparassis crispa]GBE78852.1 hypothetical protein SCP_0200490 [Sparassis crispa]